jgi:hypothetical protein
LDDITKNDIADSITSANSDVPGTFWETRPWRSWVGLLAAAVTVALVAGAFFLTPEAQARIAQFMIPPYSYVCLGLAVIALTELPDARGQRVLMAALLAALAPASVLSYAAGEVGPLFILGTHLGCMIGWVAWRRRRGWTLLWALETLTWVGIAAAQGRLMS